MIYKSPLPYDGILTEGSDDILMEGVTINKNPPAQFYDVAKSIVQDVIKSTGSLYAYKKRLLPIHRSRDIPMSQDIIFKKSCDKALELVDKLKSNGRKFLVNPSNFSINLNIRRLSWSYLTNEAATLILKPINKYGFITMRSSKNKLKAFFENILIYKVLDDKSFMILSAYVHYATYEGAFDGYTTVSLSFKAAENNNKTLKALNILEAIEIKDVDELSGIFENVEFI